MRKTAFTVGLFVVVVLGAVMASGPSVSAQYGQARGRSPAYMPMSGTYELEAGRGDNVQRAADLATRNLPPSQRDRAYQSLFHRLEPPARLAIDRNGRTVTLSSSSGPRATFDADGRSRNEPGPGGRMIVTRAEFVGDRLSVSTNGNRDTDFLVTFQPLNRGDNLLVTRQMDSPDLRRPVSVQSYYRRVRNEPDWNLYTADRAYDPGPAPRRGPRAFTMADGTRIVAVLDTALSTRTTRSGQRFSMTVQAPPEYAGARIDGTVARITPYAQGRNADMAIDFETMQLRNGQTSEFDAVLNTVRTPGGVTLRVDSSGEVPQPNRTDTAIQQGAFGAALGAIIGAVAGGGKGAAIGAVVGGAGGAILAQDQDPYLDLPRGTQVTLIVTAPRY